MDYFGGTLFREAACFYNCIKEFSTFEHILHEVNVIIRFIHFIQFYDVWVIAFPENGYFVQQTSLFLQAKFYKFTYNLIMLPLLKYLQNVSSIHTLHNMFKIYQSLRIKNRQIIWAIDDNFYWNLKFEIIFILKSWLDFV